MSAIERQAGGLAERPEFQGHQVEDVVGYGRPIAIIFIIRSARPAGPDANASRTLPERPRGIRLYAGTCRAASLNPASPWHLICLALFAWIVES